MTVDTSVESNPITATEMIITDASKAMYREVLFFPTVSPELLSQIIEDYAQRKSSAQLWTLAEAKVISVKADHYLIEVTQSRGNAEHEGKVAVLPKKNLNDDEQFSLNQIIWAVIKFHVHSSLDGGYAEEWRNVDANLVASRSESQFLTLMAYQMLGEVVTGIIHTSRGILIFPEGFDLQPLLAEGGKHKNILQELCGLKRLSLARKSPRSEIDKKLIHALKEVAGLKYGKDFKLIAANPDYLPKILVLPPVAPRMMGCGGHNLYFIKAVVGFQFEVQVVPSFNRLV
ncbi:MAG: hypothetical protein K2X81_11785, partial [Candidatus Obscuribacterales bacterium]|nr:hypothetical protein [Candidatus Obscuribacterales bacterium]